MNMSMHCVEGRIETDAELGVDSGQMAIIPIDAGAMKRIEILRGPDFHFETDISPVDKGGRMGITTILFGVAGFAEWTLREEMERTGAYVWLLTGICGHGLAFKIQPGTYPVYAEITKNEEWGSRVARLLMVPRDTVGNFVGGWTLLGCVVSETGEFIVADPGYYHKSDDEVPPFTVKFWGAGADRLGKLLFERGYLSSPLERSMECATKEEAEELKEKLRCVYEAGIAEKVEDHWDAATLLAESAPRLNAVVFSIRNSSPYWLCCKVTDSHDRGGVYPAEHGTAVGCSSGFGDGVYPAVLTRDGKGNFVSLMVTFITEDEDDE
jgi:hypothetical protein